MRKPSSWEWKLTEVLESVMSEEETEDAVQAPGPAFCLRHLTYPHTGLRALMITWPQSERKHRSVSEGKAVRPLAAVQTQDAGAVLTERQGSRKLRK